MTAQRLKVGTKVRIEALVGPTFEPDWSTTGKIVRDHASWKWSKEPIPDGYHTVRYDDSGGRMMIHRNRLMVCNEQQGA